MSVDFWQLELTAWSQWFELGSLSVLWCVWETWYLLLVQMSLGLIKGPKKWVPCATKPLPFWPADLLRLFFQAWFFSSRSSPIQSNPRKKIFELLNLQEKRAETWTSESQNKVVNLTLHRNLPHWLHNLKQKYRNDVVWFSNSLLQSKDCKGRIFILNST